ncbi:MAG: hypothetical protein OEM84_10685 [Acidimicrobiia bacterium]|nr:hypothetical protein [Acidimicrobiia bacterium]
MSAKAPDTGDRTGELDLMVNLGAVPPNVGTPAGGDYQDIVWYGTVTFDEGTYGIVYYAETISGMGKVVSHWIEDWEIYEDYPGLFTVVDGVLTDFDPLDGPGGIRRGDDSLEGVHLGGQRLHQDG